MLIPAVRPASCLFPLNSQHVASTESSGACYRLAYPLEESPHGLHTSMFIPALTGQSTAEQQKQWLNRAQQYEILGTYAQTELGHGKPCVHDVISCTGGSGCSLVHRSGYCTSNLINFLPFLVIFSLLLLHFLVEGIRHVFCCCAPSFSFHLDSFDVLCRYWQHIN